MAYSSLPDARQRYRRNSTGRAERMGRRPAPGKRHRLDAAINALRETQPHLSAGRPIEHWQKAGMLLLAAGLFAGTLAAPRATLAVLLATLTLPFFCVVVLRVVALWHLTARPPERARGGAAERAADADLPTYSVLVPLLREAAVVPGLVRALGSLDYPQDRTQVLFIVESSDPETETAVRGAGLAPNMRVVVVPRSEPQTKPKALNYALAEATGELVVVYDAEDLPEPDQLRRAAAAFREARRRGETRIGCLQARLNIYNSCASLLTRQFTIEYSALFDCILPTLQRYGLPVPLGGTSNHFPRAVLDAAGGWDPFNVTEDADLGIRLARLGWSVRVLPSTTWEEAPPTFRVWKGQRTRWLKGWMQTYLVHMREPARLARELGVKGFLGLQVLMGGMLLSALVHPWFYLLLAADAWSGWLFSEPQSTLDRYLWWIGAFNLVAGYLTGTLLGAVAIARRGLGALAAHVIAMPLYWLLISFAAYRALWQLVTAPYEWEKTEHALERHGAGRRATPALMLGAETGPDECG